MRVLIVDDSPTTRRIIGIVLKEMGVTEVLEAESVDAARTVLARPARIDLVVTDWHMPGENGLVLVKEIRASERLKNTPVVMSTSEVAGENVVAALQAGATNYIIKPFNKRQLFDKVGPIVKATLADEAEASGAHAGFLREGGLGEVVQFLMQTGKTGCCELTCANSTGRIFFERGRVCGCEYQGQCGEEAFYTCFLVEVKSYRFSELPYNIPIGCIIDADSHSLLLEAAARCDHARRSPGEATAG